MSSLKTQYLGRQHYVFGEDASHSITLSNNYINGYTNYSAGCDSCKLSGRHSY